MRRILGLAFYGVLASSVLLGGIAAAQEKPPQFLPSTEPLENSQRDYASYLVDCADRTATRRYMYPAWLSADNLDYFEKDFVMQSGPDKNWCMGADVNDNIVFRQECEMSDHDLRWQVDLFSTKSSEWKIRHVRQGKCLVSKNGGIVAGTPIVLDDCSKTETTTRWRHVAN